MTSGETENQLISRFIGGLRVQLQVALAQFTRPRLRKLTNVPSPWNFNFGHHGTQRHAIVPKTKTITRLKLFLMVRPQRTDAKKLGNNSDTNSNSCPACTNSLRCFSYGERCHIQTACPKQTKRGLIIQEQENDAPQYDDCDANQDDTTDVLQGDTGLCLVISRNCLLPKASQESWLRTNLFRSTCTINGRVCKLIIDSGSCANVISHDAVQKLGLEVRPHPSLYTFAWLNNRTGIKVSKQVSLSFSIGHYKESAMFDIVPIDAGHLLLGRPW